MLERRDTRIGPKSPRPAGAPLITMPVALIALLRCSQFSVHLSRARDGSSVWYFRFSPKAVLQVSDGGEWRWRQGTERWRAQIAPFLALAEEFVAEKATITAPGPRMVRVADAVGSPDDSSAGQRLWRT
jgi:hypothetical protein